MKASALFPVGSFLPSATVVAERLCFHRCQSMGEGKVYTPRPDTPLRWLLQRTVRILLECILLLNLFNKHFTCQRIFLLPFNEYFFYLLIANLPVDEYFVTCWVFCYQLTQYFTCWWVFSGGRCWSGWPPGGSCLAAPSRCPYSPSCRRSRRA